MFAATRASADPVSDSQLAQRLFEEARVLLARGEIPRACAAFSESQRLDPGAGTLLNLGLCHEREGKLGTAYFELEESLSRAERDHRDDRIVIARDALERLAPLAPKLTITKVDDAEVVVELDGSPFHATRAITIRADPGVHTLTASAPGRTPWRWSGDLREGDDVRVDIPVLAPMPTRKETRSISTASWALGGVSLAALVTTAIAGGLALHNEAKYRDSCNDARRFCPDESGVDAANAARNLAWVSTGALLVGLAAGVTAFLLPRTVRVSPAVGRITATLSF